MYYNFYVPCDISDNFTINTYNKNEVLKTISIQQDIIYSSLMIFSIYLGYLIYNNKSIFIKQNNPGLKYLF